ncbi:hypothetical protein SEA_BERRIE_55 [Arthrobacter phage Berrie]|uniref:Uncharacterized protein n=1 Tax=Arthrobacter phage Berrie TaxID=2926087 RepID=A0ABZ2CM11_9CAUD
MPENTTAPAPRYVPAEASFTEPATGERVESAWGVLDKQENRFAPFGGNAELAAYAAQSVTARPYLDWAFVSDFTLANS